ncbi:MAG: MoaD/ThiS family protein [Pseudomonadota bacterium]
MARVSFTAALRRHVEAPPARIDGSTVREVLERYFADRPQVRSYVLDDQGAVRKHVAIFLNQTPLQDRAAQSDPVRENDEIYVIQALSGG